MQNIVQGSWNFLIEFSDEQQFFSLFFFAEKQIRKNSSI